MKKKKTSHVFAEVTGLSKEGKLRDLGGYQKKNVLFNTSYRHTNWCRAGHRWHALSTSPTLPPTTQSHSQNTCILRTPLISRWAQTEGSDWQTCSLEPSLVSILCQGQGQMLCEADGIWRELDELADPQDDQRKTCPMLSFWGLLSYVSGTLCADVSVYCLHVFKWQRRWNWATC